MDDVELLLHDDTRRNIERYYIIDDFLMPSHTSLCDCRFPSKSKLPLTHLIVMMHII